ncbi:MAG TPA: sigma-70 family RNA polymerase sigma factor [Thermoanaerobaculia bacterium]|nr:sigma-70 family RNA polymerase sigma factor [Thermoanaerobaculia bacterium]
MSHAHSEPPSGPPLSFEGFLTRMGPRLKRLLAHYRVPAEDAEDVLQQALLALLYQWDHVRDPESWLLGTLKRHCLMYWRKQRRRLYSAVDATILEWLSEPIDPPQERQDLIWDLRHLLERLPSRCRSLLELRFRLGYEPAEVAERLGYRGSSIGKLTNRCLAALSREMLAAAAQAAPEESAAAVAPPARPEISAVEPPLDTAVATAPSAPNPLGQRRS